MLLWDYILTETANLEMGPHTNTLQMLLWDYITAHSAYIIIGLHSYTRFDLQML
jgi:hypothetical protein